MSTGKYVAYVGTYTRNKSRGIHVMDIDSDTWHMEERKVVPINNPSDLIVTADGRYLYSIADEGVRSFRILPDGDLEPMNSAWTGGMRGCYLEVDDLNRYLFVAGYHDGRVTMMKLNEDGTIGDIACGIFHEGIGRSIAEHNFIPHVTCVKLTVDQNYLCAVDSGLDHVKVYEVDYEKGDLKLHTIIHGHINSAPRMIRFRKEYRCLYILCEGDDKIYVYHYTTNRCMEGNTELLQVVNSSDDKRKDAYAACGIEFSPDGKHLFVSNAGINTVSIFEVGADGLLTKICENSVGGDYPKTIDVMPDNEHFVVLNNGGNEISTFRMNYEKNYFLMDTKPIKIEKPNNIFIHELKQ